MRHVVTEASLSTRASQWWAGIPFVTAIVVAICTIIYMVELILGYDSFSQTCLVPYMVASRFQVYRIYTSVLFHASIFHVVFNMMAMVPIGSALERIMGSVRFFHVILLLITSNGVIHVLLAYIAAHNPVYPYPDLSVECGIGFSGVIFALIVIETNMSGTQNRSIFGFFTVPAKLYPWALLFLFQLLMPSVSLLGHLSGILSGFAYTFGVYERVLCDSSAYSAVENASALGCFVRRPGFIVGGNAASGSLPSFSTGRFSGAGQRFRNALSDLRSYIPSGEALSATEASSQQRFPGRGRTLRSDDGVAPPQSSPAGRGSNNSSHAEQSRLLNRDGAPNSGMVELQPSRSNLPPIPRPAGTVTTPPVAGYPMPNQAPQPQNDSSGLQTLLAMGFDKTKVSNALAASNGDVTLAVEFLSAEGQ